MRHSVELHMRPFKAWRDCFKRKKSQIQNFDKWSSDFRNIIDVRRDIFTGLATWPKLTSSQTYKIGSFELVIHIVLQKLYTSISPSYVIFYFAQVKRSILYEFLSSSSLRGWPVTCGTDNLICALSLLWTEVWTAKLILTQHRKGNPWRGQKYQHYNVKGNWSRRERDCVCVCVCFK